MFKSFKGKITAAVLSTLMLLAVLPTTALANTNTPAFTQIRVNQTSINATQSVVVNVSTLNAEFVFAHVNGGFEAGVRGERNTTTGETNWTLTFRPVDNQIVSIYANTVNNQNGAASLSLPIAVTGGSAGQQAQTPTQQTGTGQHRIYDIEEVAAAANNVTLRIVTDARVNNVWINLGPGLYRQAASSSQTPTQRIWSVTYRPPQAGAHQVTVSANHAFIVDQHVVSQRFNVTREIAPTSSPSPSSGNNQASNVSINRVSVSPTPAIRNARATITIRASRDVQHVWAQVDGRRVNARRVQGGATVSTWEMEITPDRTQTIEFYANTVNNASGAATYSFRLEVQTEANPRIINITPSTIELWAQQPGSATTLVIRTNNDTEYVWAEVNGNRVRATSFRTVSSQREWEIVVRPEWTQQIRVYAHTRNNNNDGRAYTRNVTVVNNH